MMSTDRARVLLVPARPGERDGRAERVTEHDDGAGEPEPGDDAVEVIGLGGEGLRVRRRVAATDAEPVVQAHLSMRGQVLEVGPGVVHGPPVVGHGDDRGSAAVAPGPEVPAREDDVAFEPGRRGRGGRSSPAVLVPRAEVAVEVVVVGVVEATGWVSAVQPVRPSPRAKPAAASALPWAG